MTAARRQAQTRTASAADARAYLDKAREFQRAAEDSLGLGNRVAAAGNAVHAGIGAADAITAARAAVVWKGEHSQAPAHLEKVGGEEGRGTGRKHPQVISHWEPLLPDLARRNVRPTGDCVR